ncbi:MAG: efflux RND transporter periplasmic adaptor subunit, partial [Flavobacteriales bacterium]|nr:efflux RND transporter periplasmic adaptor subunit [Flavobacteriales bacterium]
EELLVDFTGERVAIGRPLAVLYAPELVTAEEELLQAHRTRDAQPALYQAAR